MQTKSHFWTNEYGRKIFCISIKADTPEKGCIGFVHGLGEHISRYTEMFRFFAANGYSVYGFDTYGHGRSEGKRGHLHSENQWTNELKMLMEWMESESQRPKILLGHSMGGLRVLSYLAHHQHLPELAIVTAPFVAQTQPEPRLKIWAGKQLGRLFPSLTLNNGLEVDGISRNAAVVQAYHDDPYVHAEISLRLAAIAFDTADKLRTTPHTLSVPLMLHHGTSDRLTSHDATRELSRNWQGDITFCSWEGGYHELHNDLDKERLFQQMLDWLDSRLSPSVGEGQS
ncbi:MAG: alpha/beta hydrolase [Capnocytophaga sp.]|nr:alpha/beta hydrolase [Capnocytophaga sp.]